MSEGVSLSLFWLQLLLILWCSCAGWRSVSSLASKDWDYSLLCRFPPDSSAFCSTRSAVLSAEAPEPTRLMIKLHRINIDIVGSGPVCWSRTCSCDKNLNKNDQNMFLTSIQPSSILILFTFTMKLFLVAVTWNQENTSSLENWIQPEDLLLTTQGCSSSTDH